MKVDITFADRACAGLILSVLSAITGYWVGVDHQLGAALLQVSVVFIVFAAIMIVAHIYLSYKGVEKQW